MYKAAVWGWGMAAAEDQQEGRAHLPGNTEQPPTPPSDARAPSKGLLCSSEAAKAGLRGSSQLSEDVGGGWG